MRLIDIDAIPKREMNDPVWVCLTKQPHVDAVSVVRCKDCKHLYDGMDDYCCTSHRGLVRICENSFCSYGERRADGKDA